MLVARFAPLCALLILAMQANALASQEAAITVIRTLDTGTFKSAEVRDSTMLAGHDRYYVAIGAHIGHAVVSQILPDGVRLSNGHFLRAVVCRAAAPSAIAENKNRP